MASAYLWSRGGSSGCGSMLWDGDVVSCRQFPLHSRCWYKFLVRGSQNKELGRCTHKGTLVFSTRDKGLQINRTQSPAYVCTWPAVPLRLGEEVCPFFGNEIAPSTRYRQVLPDQNFNSLGRDNQDFLKCWHHTTGKVHLLKCHHQNLRTTIHKPF